MTNAVFSSWGSAARLPRALVAAGVLRREKDGVKLLGKGELKSKIEITVYSASASAKAAVEKAGGKVTTTAPAAAEAAE